MGTSISVTKSESLRQENSIKKKNRENSMPSESKSNYNQSISKNNNNQNQTQINRAYGNKVNQKISAQFLDPQIKKQPKNIHNNQMIENSKNESIIHKQSVKEFNRKDSSKRQAKNANQPQQKIQKYRINIQQQQKVDNKSKEIKRLSVNKNQAEVDRFQRRRSNTEIQGDKCNLFGNKIEEKYQNERRPEVVLKQPAFEEQFHTYDWEIPKETTSPIKSKNKLQPESSIMMIAKANLSDFGQKQEQLPKKWKNRRQFMHQVVNGRVSQIDQGFIISNFCKQTDSEFNRQGLSQFSIKICPQISKS